MRAAIALLLVAGTVTGCASTPGRLAIGGAGASLGGIVILASRPDSMNQFGQRTSGGTFETFGTVLMLGGLVTLFTAAALSEKRDEAKPIEIDWDRVLRAEAEHRAKAWRLAQEGFVAARRHDCATVAKLAQDVHDLDEGLYLFVYLRDVAVGTCISTEEAEDPTAPEPGDPDEPPY